MPKEEEVEMARRRVRWAYMRTCSVNATERDEEILRETEDHLAALEAKEAEEAVG